MSQPGQRLFDVKVSLSWSLSAAGCHHHPVKVKMLKVKVMENWKTFLMKTVMVRMLHHFAVTINWFLEEVKIIDNRKVFVKITFHLLVRIRDPFWQRPHLHRGMTLSAQTKMACLMSDEQAADVKINWLWMKDPVKIRTFLVTIRVLVEQLSVKIKMILEPAVKITGQL